MWQKKYFQILFFFYSWAVVVKLILPPSRGDLHAIILLTAYPTRELVNVTVEYRSLYFKLILPVTELTWQWNIHHSTSNSPCLWLSIRSSSIHILLYISGREVVLTLLPAELCDYSFIIAYNGIIFHSSVDIDDWTIKIHNTPFKYWQKNTK